MSQTGSHVLFWLSWRGHSIMSQMDVLARTFTVGRPIKFFCAQMENWKVAEK